ncbi:C40 family peptidase [Paenibacillus sp. IHBB 10380]|uniref:C40 family peptidase n=1 Tax=Paenibacillus sp. IHBB 10380 TaxID=1566358 RepID=UPI0005CFC7CC|nr:NlpC/P60 family protein [Paenibacillus sp. IHBB 10380]AJS58739.1 hypothetical protein UB51_09875 [Paenibacillus sp. IHBB 10380]
MNLEELSAQYLDAAHKLTVADNQVANGILPWPKVNKAPKSTVSTPAKENSEAKEEGKAPATPKKPVEEQPKSTPSNSSAEEKRKAIVDFSKQFLGKIPYCMDTKIKTMIIDPNSPPPYMDCSDFTSSVYLIILNKHIGGTTRDQIYRGTKVDHHSLRASGNYNNLKLVDLILFNWKKNTKTPTHVGIYIGDGKFIHEHGNAQTPEEMRRDNKPSHNVTIDKLNENWGTSYGYIYTNVMGVRRIIQEDGSIKNN